MKFLSDKALARLREVADIPDLSGTRYRLLERVARGGMGVVYAAHDQKLERRVALKVLDVPHAGTELANRLIREARVLARLEHPGIVPVHDVGTLEDGRVFYTMKFVEGQRLDHHVQTVAGVADRLRLFLRICDAVAFAHAHGVLHRDLKPANVMVGPFGEILVMDWGLAKIFRAGASGKPPEAEAETLIAPPRSADSADADTQITAATGHGTVLGTPGYMSPEQERGDIEHLDERSDVFSLGAMLQFLVSGNSETRKSSRPAVEKALQAICAKAMASNPAERYPAVTELAADVSRYLNGLPVQARRESLLEKAGRFYRRYNVAILLILAYVVMRVVLLLISGR